MKAKKSSDSLESLNSDLDQSPQIFSEYQCLDMRPKGIEEIHVQSIPSPK
jgi:hypothetical protein